MFPALAVSTPRSVCSGAACRIALTAPRILNEPIGCRHSSLSQISAAASGASRRTSGVRIAAPRIVSRARSSWARSIGASSIRSRPRSRRPARGRGRRTSSAAARSSTASPSDLKIVSSSSEVRPGWALTSTSPSSARMCSGPIAPSSTAARYSPDSFSVDSRRSTKREPAAIVSASSSRAHGTLEPTAFTCAPGFSHASESTGSLEFVQVQTTSASRTRPSALPPLLRLQERISASGTTARSACSCERP